MKRVFAAVVLMAALSTTACNQRGEAEAAPGGDAGLGTASENAAEAGTTPEVEGRSDVASGPATVAVPGAPAFAVLYPGATPQGPATIAQGPSGPGGIVTFTTPAPPEEVVAFYRRKAEAAGLKSINAMNTGGAHGYSAGDGADGRGQLLMVVATPVEDGPTNVQLDWAAGK